MHLLVETILLALAGWRLAHLLVSEDGPFDVFERIRYLFGLREGPITGFFPKLFSCMWCMTVWTTAGAYFLWCVEPIIVVILAATALSIGYEVALENKNQ